MSLASLGARIADVAGEAIALRRDLHRVPEIGLRLPRTQERVLDALDGLDLRLEVGQHVSSVVAMLDGDRPGPTRLLRADMDALPLSEDTGLEYASVVDGAMHACGHDMHTAMLAAAAKVLAERRAELTGRVLFMFQPGEEGCQGARCMLEEGLLDPERVGDVARAFALHQTPAFSTGTIVCRGGSMMASSDVLRIVVTGRGGHAAGPHRARDPIPVVCEIVQAIQAMVARRIEPFDPAIVSVTQITAGTAVNVIPETAELRGSIRATSEGTRRDVLESLVRIGEGVAAAHEMRATVEIEERYPVTVNDEASADWVLSVAEEAFGAERVIRYHRPMMGSEDFSYVLRQVPGAVAFLGSCPPGMDPRRAPVNHSNRMIADEAAMTTGIEMYARVALHALT